MRKLYSLVIAACLSTGCKSELTTVTYNTALLPQVFSPIDADKNAPIMAEKLKGLSTDENKDYIVFTQEVFDFNYEQLLSQESNFPYQTKNPEEIFSLGDGLKIFSDFKINKVIRKPWRDCNGKYSDGSDCLTPKGSMYANIEISGINIFGVDTHFDSGNSLKDKETRNLQIQQFIEDFNNITQGQAAIVTGDFNTVNKIPLGLLKMHTGLEDVCNVVSCPDDRIDKVYFKNNDFITLTPKSYSLDAALFVDEENQPLSDHLPIFVNWEITFGPPGTNNLVDKFD